MIQFKPFEQGVFDEGSSAFRYWNILTFNVSKTFFFGFNCSSGSEKQIDA